MPKQQIYTASIIFSNGHAISYTGTRRMNAAWCLSSQKTGATLAAGYTVTRKQAAEAAAVNVLPLAELPHGWNPPFEIPQNTYRPPHTWCRDAFERLHALRRLGPEKHSGFRLVQLARAYNRDLQAVILRTDVQIEILDVLCQANGQ